MTIYKFINVIKYNPKIEGSVYEGHTDTWN